VARVKSSPGPDRERLRRLLERVRRGKIDIAQAVDEIALAPVARLGFATVDLERAARRGFPEVIYGAGKATDEITEIARRLVEVGQALLVTRVGPEVHAALLDVAPRARYHEHARAVTLPGRSTRRPRPGVTVITAGTTDRAVAEEAIVTAELMGSAVRRVFDVGIAGVHRLLEHPDIFLRSRVLVVVAGMEGALPSLVAGLTSCPVIGVPTSTGYGAGAHGLAALLAMLNSCAPGLTVVNIDNGFGAGYAAAVINAQSRK